MIKTLKKLSIAIVLLTLYGFISTGHIPLEAHIETIVSEPYTGDRIDSSQTAPAIELALMPTATEAPVVDDERRLPKGVQLRLALAKVCVSEAGFQTSTNDCALIFQALKTRSHMHQVSLGMMHAYSPDVFNKNRRDARRWVPYLNASFTEPEHWSETVRVPWTARSAAWRSVYNLASELIRTNPANSCGVRIDHWGAKHFRRREHLREGWTIVECGVTKNAFWTMH